MFNSNATLPVSIPLNAGGFGGGGFGNDFDSIIALAIIAMIFGWNNNGGLFGGNSGGVQDGYILSSDFSNLSRQLSDGFASQERRTDTIINGISNIGYENLSNFNAVNQAINNSMVNDSNNTRDILTALSDCCCKNQTSFLQAQYNAATEACATRQAIADAKSEIVGAIKQQSIDAMAADLAEKDRMLNNQWLLGQINKTPVPAYVVQNPYCNCNYPYYQTGTTLV